MPSVGQELLNVPMGDMIRSMAFAIADAQWALDKSSIIVAEVMSGSWIRRDPDSLLPIGEDGKPVDPGSAKPTQTLVRFGGEDVSMMELGFTPTFYQFVDTIIEVKIDIKMTTTREAEVKREDKVDSKGRSVTYSRSRLGWYAHASPPQTRVTTVTATYSNTYSYSVEGSSLLRTKLVPVPPPAILEERIRALVDERATQQPEE